MSEMVGVAGPAGPMGNGRVQNGAQAPVSMQVPSQPPSGVRTPTDIMRQRRDREARRKAEQEARDREQEDLERQQLEQEQAAVVQAQARAQAHQQLSGGAAGASDSASQRRTRVPRTRPEAQSDAPMPVTAPGVAPNFRATAPATQMGGRPDYGNPQNPASSQPQLGSVPQGRPQSATAAGTGQQTGTSGISKQPGGQTGTSQTLQQPQRVSFPHAFERWETLSSHWEGLTSYWVRKMEENKDDVEADPISKQLARQITDLSAAGANLFHAVVELQRLRASSERKFQRWFFDTRAEQERAKEVQADLERQLKAERQGRADAYAAAQAAEQDKVRAEGLVQEMRRELQISKEEARRAWEELGRREQEERERTNSLRNGEPTLVGGVQVVPMIQGVPTRHTRPPTQEEPYTTAPPPIESEYQPKPSDQTGGRTFYDESTAMSPTGSDPFVEAGKVQAVHPASKAPYSGEMYSHEGNPPYPAAMETDAQSYVGSSEAGEEEYAYNPQEHPQSGHTYGYPAPPSEGSDEYEHGDDRQHYVTSGAYTTTGTSAPVHAPYPPPTADYSGSDWGVGSGWESVTPRHRHPTRLSDVLEEDEPSRTSPSRASQASRSQASRSII